MRTFTNKTYYEIINQPDVLVRVAKEYNELSKNIKEFIIKNNIKKIDFVGCGSSYFLSQALSCHLKRVTDNKFDSDYYTGSEVLLGLKKLEKGTMLIGLSRSGDSTETVKALEFAKDNGVFAGGITCKKDCLIDKTADVNVPLDFVKQESVVMTAGYTATAFFASLLFNELSGKEVQEYKDRVPEVTDKFIKDSEELLNRINISEFNHFTFLGYNEKYATGMEGIIKLTEMAQVSVDAFQSLEYRHGPKSKSGENTLVTILASAETIEYELDLAHEIEELGSTVIIVSDKKDINFENSIYLESIESVEWFINVVLIQLVGLYTADANNLNPDYPKNLQHVVMMDID